MKLDLNSYSVQSKNPKIKGKFIDREISWLSFNNRVLFCANDTSIPLNERLKFLAISSSNLDEFISVRYSTAISEQSESLKNILIGIKTQMEYQSLTYHSLKGELKKNGIAISKIQDLSHTEMDKLKYIYQHDIFPLLTPINIGSTNELPNFYSGQSCIAVIVTQGNVENLILIPISKVLDKMYQINNKIIMVEDIIMEFIGNLCVNKEIVCIGSFKVIKDANITVSHDSSKFLLDRMIATIEQRDTANVIFMIVNGNTPKKLKNILISVFGISKKMYLANQVY